MKTMPLKVKIEISKTSASSKVSNEIIKIFGLSKNGWQETLSNLDVPKEGIILITGSSGVGKTLLLKKNYGVYP